MDQSLADIWNDGGIVKPAVLKSSYGDFFLLQSALGADWYMGMNLTQNRTTNTFVSSGTIIYSGSDAIWSLV